MLNSQIHYLKFQEPLKKLLSESSKFSIYSHFSPPCIGTAISYIYLFIEYYLYTEKIFEEHLYNNIAITGIQHSKIYFVHTFSDYFHTVEKNSLKSVWKISLCILASTPRVEGSNDYTV